MPSVEEDIDDIPNLAPDSDDDEDDVSDEAIEEDDRIFAVTFREQPKDIRAMATVVDKQTQQTCYLKIN